MNLPSEGFELTANSLGAHFEDSQLTVNSQDELTLRACCEFSVSLKLSQ